MANLKTINRHLSRQVTEGRGSPVSGKPISGWGLNPDLPKRSRKLPPVLTLGLWHQICLLMHRVCRDSKKASSPPPPLPQRPANDAECSTELSVFRRFERRAEPYTYPSFHILVNEEDFHVTNNTPEWPNGCLITRFWGRLSYDEPYSFPNAE